MVFCSPWGLLHHPSDGIFSAGVKPTMGGFYISTGWFHSLSTKKTKKKYMYLLGAITLRSPD